MYICHNNKFYILWQSRLLSLYFIIEFGCLPSTSKQSNMDMGREQSYILLLDFYRATNEWANGINDNITKHLTSTNKKFFLKICLMLHDDNELNPNWWNFILVTFLMETSNNIIIRWCGMDIVQTLCATRLEEHSMYRLTSPKEYSAVWIFLPQYSNFRS